MKLAFAIGTSIGLVGVPASVGATEIGAPTREPVNDTRQTYDSSSPSFIGSTAKIIYDHKGKTKKYSANSVSQSPEVPGFVIVGSGHCAKEILESANHTVSSPHSTRNFYIEKIINWEAKNADYSIMKLNKKPSNSEVLPPYVHPRVKLNKVRRNRKTKYFTMGYGSNEMLKFDQKCREIGRGHITRLTDCKGSPGNSGGAAVAVSKGYYYLVGTIKGSEDGNKEMHLKITTVEYYENELSSALDMYN